MADYREVPYRILNLVVYLLAALVNSLPVHTFSSINSSVETAFEYPKELVTANALIFTILHPIGAFPANWILDKYGSRIGCILGSVFVIAGVWIRTLMQKG
jgi:fucose permease